MLTLRSLTCRFGQVVAVDSVSLDIPAGQMVGVIGRSGAGKSTLLRMINRLQKPTSGTIAFDGADITRLRGRALRDWRARCGMVFQQFNLTGRLDVLTNVLIGRLHRRPLLASLCGWFSAEDRLDALRILERFELADIALQRVDTLSGGQQQRVAICRAMMQRPEILLADEPVSSLDPHNAQRVMDALRTISREDGITVLANLHHLDTARAYCTRIVAMQAGRIVFDGPPDMLTSERLHAIYGTAGQDEDRAGAAQLLSA